MKKILFMILFAFILVGMASAQQIGEQVYLGDEYGDNQYVIGGVIDVTGELGGDFVAVGGEINTNGTVSDDLLFAGSMISLKGLVGGDARLMGNYVKVDAPIFGDLAFLGNQIVITNESTIGGKAFLAGNSISVRGDYLDDVKIAGNYVYIDSVIQGDLSLSASSLRLGPNAKFEGDVLLSDNLNIDESLVEGEISVLPQDEMWGSESSSYSVWDFIISVLTIFLIGLVISLIARKYTLNVMATAMRRPLMAFIIGIVSFIVIPLLTVLLLFTVVGIPIGILLLLAFIALLIMTIPFTALFLGGIIFKIFSVKGDILLQMLIGTIVFIILPFIPIVGPIIVLLSGIISFGALVRNIFGKDKKALSRKKKKTKKRKAKKKA